MLSIINARSVKMDSSLTVLILLAKLVVALAALTSFHASAAQTTHGEMAPPRLVRFAREKQKLKPHLLNPHLVQAVM